MAYTALHIGKHLLVSLFRSFFPSGLTKKGKKLYFYEDELLAWIENGRKKTSEQTYEEMLANMQSGVRHKPKSSVQF